MTAQATLCRFWVKLWGVWVKLCGVWVKLCRNMTRMEGKSKFQMAATGVYRAPNTILTTPFCSIFCVDSFLLIYNTYGKI